MSVVLANYESCYAITPSDTVDQGFSALYIGGTGAVVIVNMAGVAVTFAAVPVGVLPVAGKRVNATGTAATNIVGLA